MITYEIAKALFNYDPETGLLTWKFSSQSIKEGAEVGTYDKTPKSNTRYRKVSVFRENYKVHRIIWLMQTGDWPKGDVDHIDGDGLNNKWENLRDITHSQNLMNAAVRSDSTSGYKGVSYDSRRDKWYAYINIDGKRKMLGRHRTMQEAITARRDAEQDLFGEFARES
jgi:hypothetical protein